jgi:hypothetical protein
MMPVRSLGPSRRAPPEAHLFAAMDYWHRAPASARPSPGYKEWSHFSIMGDELDLLINFSLMENPRHGDSQTAPRPRREVGHLTLLYRDAAGCWDGEVERYDGTAVSVQGGHPDIALGANKARIVDGVYRVRLDLPSGTVQGEIDLVPVARPVFANRVPLAGAEYIRWLVVPRLTASGEVRLGGRSFVLDDAPAYHDRNWGQFTWGGSCAWEWATILPADPDTAWSLVYSRISDGLRAATLSQSLILWRGAWPHRKFFGRDLRIEQRGVLSGCRPVQIPKFAALLSAGIGADLPRKMLVRAAAYRDELCLEIDLADFAQIGIPNDRRWGVSKLSEATGRVQVRGAVGGQRVRFDGRIHAEFNQPGA